MKKIKLMLFAFIFFLSTVGVASALTFDYTNPKTAWIDFNGSGRDTNHTFSLNLPDWYDSNLLSAFNITLNGTNANTSQTIHFFLRDEDASTWYAVDSYNQSQTSSNFSHTFDILGSSFNLSLFNTDSYFEAAYGCHFDHVTTSVHIEQRNPVPEPTSILLMGIGILGIAGFSRKKFIKW